MREWEGGRERWDRVTRAIGRAACGADDAMPNNSRRDYPNRSPASSTSARLGRHVFVGRARRVEKRRLASHITCQPRQRQYSYFSTSKASKAVSSLYTAPSCRPLRRLAHLANSMLLTKPLCYELNLYATN